MFTLPPRDSTLQYKRCVHFWNNFPCITSLGLKYLLEMKQYLSLQLLSCINISLNYAMPDCFHASNIGALYWYILKYWCTAWLFYASNIDLKRHCLAAFRCYLVQTINSLNEFVKCSFELFFCLFKLLFWTINVIVQMTLKNSPNEEQNSLKKQKTVQIDIKIVQMNNKK